MMSARKSRSRLHHRESGLVEWTTQWTTGRRIMGIRKRRLIVGRLGDEGLLAFAGVASHTCANRKKISQRRNRAWMIRSQSCFGQTVESTFTENCIRGKTKRLTREAPKRPWTCRVNVFARHPLFSDCRQVIRKLGEARTSSMYGPAVGCDGQAV
ncbi:hypothetical protein B0H66DRAFT_173833 [Apodospora peruviana]|uniref:Uncharacterized protein n=1 Tax=Apodospora peruviana TaxID=516989 RepID=A0AAE0M779_9PEZI|nr:hypothetical protein B0H66DRAFT_173833 [Apodospora peruviana]